MKMGMRRLAIVAAAVAVLGVFQKAQADSMTLAQLLNGGELVCGDKVFKNFKSFSSFGTGGATAPSADEINVVCLNTGDVVEIGFQSASWSVNAGQTMDTFFEFDVYVMGPAVITEVGAAFRGFSSSGGGSVHLDEAVFGSSTFPYNPFLGTIGLDTLTGPISDSLALSEGYKMLHITKDLALDARQGGRASISLFTQRFVQTVVPEPSSVVLLGMGATMLVGYGWRRRKSS